jgi:membrane fusion protein (multidrug efflux system)
VKLASVLLFSSSLFLAGCHNNAVPTSEAAPVPSKPATASTSNSPEDNFLASGPIVVENQIDVATQRDGIVSELLADTGTSVRKGQLLARLDDRQLTADTEAARNQAASIEADLKNWEATVKMAEVDLDRSEKMYQGGLITGSQLDHDRFKLTATKYELDRERKNFERAQNIFKSLDLELEKTRIAAPFDGIVARRYVRNGQRVANGDRLFWVTATGPLHLRFSLSEKYASTVKKASLLEITPADSPNEKFQGRVLMVSPVIDPASSTFDVIAEFVGPTGNLKPGMITNIRLQTER